MALVIIELKITQGLVLNEKGFLKALGIIEVRMTMGLVSKL